MPGSIHRGYTPRTYRRRLPWSGPDEHLQRGAVGHRAVAVGYRVEGDETVEDPARFDPAVEHVGQQLLKVGTGRCRAAGDGDAAHEHVRPERSLLVLRDADPADRAADPYHAERGLQRVPCTDAFEHRVGTVAAGQVAYPADALRAPLGDHLGRAELAAQVGAVLVPAEQQDPFGTEPPGRQYRAKPDSAVADHRDGRALADPRLDRGVVSGGEDVGEREQRRQQGRVRADGQFHQRALCLRAPYRPALAAVPPVQAVPAAVPAGRVQPLAAEVAGVVRPDERRHDEVAPLEAGHVGAGVLDDAEELVAHGPALRRCRHRRVGPQVATADRGAQDAYHGVAGSLDARIGPVLHAYVTDAVHDGCSHAVSPDQLVGAVAVQLARRFRASADGEPGSAL